MSVACPYCRKVIALKGLKPGRFTPKCPGCGNLMEAPAAPAAVPSQAREDQRTMPPVLSVAVNKVIEESPEVTVLAQAKPGSVMEAMDALYEIQDSLMYNQIEDE